MSTRITLTNLTKRFPSGGIMTRLRGGGGIDGRVGVASTSAAAAVDGVSLTIEPGELFFLLGPSGCGKTTLLRMIAGFIEPTGGTITFTTADGRSRDVTHVPPNKRNTGMVFQSYALWPHMTVESNVAFGLSVRKVPAAERSRRAVEALDLVRMGEYAGRKPNQLSGGQQQRVALARALVIRPDVLLLDEPLSNLDAKLRIDLRSEIRRICKESRAGTASQSGMTTVYVTHDQKEALSMADRVAIMRSGRIVQIGTPEELYRSPRSRFVAEFLGETNFVEATVRAIEPASASDAAFARVVIMDSPLGPLRAHSGTSVSPGQRVACSIRPEAIKVYPAAAAGDAGPVENRFVADVIESTYLGEMVQYTLDVRGGQGERARLKAALFNPPPAPQPAGAGSRGRAIRIDSKDVVVLAE
ncbi:MAG: ABC transporter ATP-binding protein [Phycisphaerales bacterium]